MNSTVQVYRYCVHVQGVHVQYMCRGGTRGSTGGVLCVLMHLKNISEKSWYPS